MKCNLKVGERMIIFWRHFFIVVVEASSSRALLLLPTFHHFPPYLYARTCVRNYCGVPTVPFVPASLFITLFFLQRGTPAVSARKKHYCSFRRLEIKSYYSVGSPSRIFVRFIYTSLRSRSHTFNYQPVSSHPAAEYHCTD